MGRWDDSSFMKVLIVGGHGMLGRPVVRILLVDQAHVPQVLL